MSVTAKKNPLFAPRIGTILLIVNLTILLLPLGSLTFFRFFENELVRQTEQELIAQGAVLAAVYKQILMEELGGRASSYGGTILQEQKNDQFDDVYSPVLPQLDLSRDSILPPRPDGQVSDGAPLDTLEKRAGEKIDAIILETKNVTLTGIRILDYRGNVISRQERGVSYGEIPEIREALQGKYSSVIRERISDEQPPALASISRGTNVRIFVVYPIISDNHVWGVVSLSRTPKNILKYMYEERVKLAIAGLFLIILTVAIAFLTSYFISRPIKFLMTNIHDIEEGRCPRSAECTYFSAREIAELSSHFSRMTKILQERSDYIRNFAMHVSHEFKTPLTSMRGAVEIMQDHGDLSVQEKTHFMTLILKDIDRLRNLVNRLLELARADNMAVDTGQTHLLGVLKDLRGWYKEKNIDITMKGNDEAAINMTPENITTIFTNLFDNSLAHGASEVNVFCEQSRSTVTCVIQDNGAGISAENMDKIFTPFFTTRREEGGTGLGLDIARSILRAHQGDIVVVPSEKGARFIMSLPYQK